MNKAISISIPEPCHEDWGQMTPNEQGRFCNACAKTVVDFSVMTDTQVLNYLIDKQHEKVCGRLLTEQMDTPISIVKPAKRIVKWYWNAAAAIALLFSRSEAKAQQPVKTETAPVRFDGKDQLVRGELAVRPANQASGELKGTVVDKEGNPVPFASVVVKDGLTGVAADVGGNFVIKAVTGTVLRFTAAGFEQKEFTVGTERSCRIVLETNVRAMKGEVIIRMGYAVARPVRKFKPGKAVFLIREEETGKAIPGASISVKTVGTGSEINEKTSGKGKYTMKDFFRNKQYLVTITAEGYEANELMIKADYSTDKNLEREVRLSKTGSPARWVTGGLSVQTITGDPVTVCTKDTTYLSKTEEPLKPGPVPVLAVNENSLTGQHAVSIYPNPVSHGNAMQIAWVVKQKGPHTILVNNSAGLLVWQKQETVLPGKFQTSILLDEKWSSGMYYVRILNPKGEQISENSFIVQ